MSWLVSLRFDGTFNLDRHSSPGGPLSFGWVLLYGTNAYEHFMTSASQQYQYINNVHHRGIDACMQAVRPESMQASGQGMRSCMSS